MHTMSNGLSICSDSSDPALRHANGVQKLLVFQQNAKAENKVRGIQKHGQNLFELEIISIESALPPVLDDSSEYLPSQFQADLVLDYLKHPDLSHDLAVLCKKGGIPLVASGKKIHAQGAFTPPTCCALLRDFRLGSYGEHFGVPEFAIEIEGERIRKITVLRGAPCGASWEAATRLTGAPVEDAAIRLGLEVQFFCTADPSGWDPIHGKSPVHLAAEIHRASFGRALQINRSSR